MNHKPRHVGQAIVDSLVRHDVKRVFSVPGESFLAVLDGLHGAAVETVVARHEGGAAYMAEAHGKYTGEPGVAMVTRGPGAANAAVAVHTAWQDGTPMVLFVGLIPTADRMREAFQEFDPYAWFGSQTKRVFVLDEPDRASEIVAEAFFAAKSGRPGPVVVGLPEDVITKSFANELSAPIPVAEGAVSEREIEEVRRALIKADKPLLFLGGQRWTPEAAAAVTTFAERNGIPVAQDWHASDRVPFTSKANIGSLGYGRNVAAAEMFEEADVLLAVGAVPTDVPTDGFNLRQRSDAVNYLINVDTTLRGRSGTVTAHILASPTAFVEAVRDLDLGKAAEWESWRQRGHEAHLQSSRVGNYDDLPTTAAGTAHMSVVINELFRRLPEDAVCTLGAGNHTVWAQRFFPTNVFPSQLATRNGSMGYSIPSAIAAGIETPERLVVAVCGDGEFMMNGQELATAAQYDVPVLTIVMDNGQFGTIRDHQEKHFPGRISGTQLSNPDFAGLMRSYGGHSETVTSDAEAPSAVERALKSVQEQRKSALIHVLTDQAISLP